jgi:TusE/DsrC/DsvC family sulfur relay protein
MITDSASHVLETDAEGYLVNPSDWDDEVAMQLAQEEGITLTDVHWLILRFMRQFYDEHQVAADVRFVIKFLDNDLGYNKKGRELLFKLFPYGYVKQACKIAGMKRPRGWSTG